jgi:hypothetical protein
LTAVGVTWLAGSLSASAQRELDERKFEADLVMKAITSDREQTIKNLKFLVATGLIQNNSKRLFGDALPTLPEKK